MSKGFTLIELLVVVLIIGILSSIAIPQYNIAVEKSRSAEAVSTGAKIVEAMDRAYTERPYMAPNTKGSLDIQPGKACWTSSHAFSTKNFSYDLTDGTYLEIKRDVKGGSYTLKMYTEASTQPGARTCSSVGETGEMVCKSLRSAGFSN